MCVRPLVPDGRNVLHLIFEGQLSRMRHTSEHSEDAVPVHLRSSLKNCLRLFGARGANVEQRDVIGNLPLAYALVFNHFSLVPAVLDMSTPKNLDLLAPVCYTHVMPVKPECQESDYDEYLHANEERREPAEGMSAEDKAKLGQVTRWLAAMREYRRRERSLSSFRQYAGESALHFFVKQGKLELVRAGLSRMHTSRHATFLPLCSRTCAGAGGNRSLGRPSRDQHVHLHFWYAHHPTMTAMLLGHHTLGLTPFVAA